MFVLKNLMSLFIKMAYSLKNRAILSGKGVTFKCFLMGISKNEALKKLNNSATYDEEYCKYEFWSQ